MLQPYVNAKQIKELFYDSTLQPTATSVNFTVENCNVNAFIEQIIINFSSADATASNIVCSLNDRGHAYPATINGFNPVTFASVGYSTTPLSLQNLVPNSSNTKANIFVYESVQDSEGIGNIYVNLTKSTGSFNISFTMTVIYRPEATYNIRFDSLNQIDTRRPQRILSQIGLGTFGDPASSMIDQSSFVAHRVNPRNNLDIANFGFQVSSANPYFYFGTPAQTKRWFIGFSSDCTPNIGLVTFSYFNGSSFVGMGSTQCFVGAQGPGTYQFANDGVIIFNPPTGWSPLTMVNDPTTKINTTTIGLGTLSPNQIIPNPGMYWIQCQVGFATTASITVSTVQPLIAVDHALTVRRRIFQN